VPNVCGKARVGSAFVTWRFGRPAQNANYFLYILCGSLCVACTAEVSFRELRGVLSDCVALDVSHLILPCGGCGGGCAVVRGGVVVRGGQLETGQDSI